MGKKMNSNIRRAVTDGAFAVPICQACMFDPKKEILYWPSEMLSYKSVKNNSIIIQ